MLIGLTGIIGSGKSTVAAILAELGYPVISADDLAKEATGTGAPLLNDIAKLFGEDVILETGELDRKKVAEIIFSNPEMKKAYEALIHPVISEAFKRRLHEVEKSQKSPIIFYDVPLLFECNMLNLFDKIVVVSAAEDTCLRRIMSRSSSSLEEAKHRYDSQMSLSEKIPFADIVISNDGSLDELSKQVISHFPPLSRL